MTPVPKVNISGACKLLKLNGKPLTYRMFKSIAKKLPFKEYPGVGSEVWYDEQDIIEQWNKTRDEFGAKRKRRGQIL